jgi:diaminopimelate epimerase
VAGAHATRELEFTKMHGAGNDFVLLDGLRDELPADLPTMEAFVRHIGHRQLGIGCDQILIARPPIDPECADFRMEIYNQDGSQVEMCGNGIRAFFKYLRDRGHTEADELRVETLGGVVRPRWAGTARGGTAAAREDLIQVDMGRPVLAPAKIPTTLTSGADGSDGPVLDVTLNLDHEGDHASVTVSSASMGNPHAVIVVDDVEAAPVSTLGPLVENHPAFPARTNVEFIEIVARNHIRQRTWERGVGETLACGSGACAVGVVSMLRGVVEREVRVELRGGDLTIAWPGGDASVLMTGPAAEVFTGRIPFPE